MSFFVRRMFDLQEHLSRLESPLLFSGPPLLWNYGKASFSLHGMMTVLGLLQDHESISKEV